MTRFSRIQRKPWCILVALCIVFAAERVHASPDPMLPGLDAAVARVKPAIVQIQTVSSIFKDGREIRYENSGSGTIITEDGHVVTNHHVAGHAVRIFCTLADKEEYEAELVGSDPLSDLTVIRLKNPQHRKFPFAEFGDDTRLNVGDPVLALGSPVSLSQSVTLGVISNLGMTIPLIYQKKSYKFKLDGEDVGAFMLWIGHDAAIFPGNSGGPLVNMRGEVIGINEIAIGLGGAIPSRLAEKVAHQLIERGKVSRSYIGWEVQPMLKDMPTEQGVLVSSVIKNSPAAKGGLMSGDVILEINQKPVQVRFMDELPLFHQYVADLPVGQAVDIDFKRNGQLKKTRLVTVERTPARLKPMEVKEWGITISNISDIQSHELKQDRNQGVIITSVQTGGASGQAKPPLQAWDIIIAVNNMPIHSASDFKMLTQKIVSDAEAPVATSITFERKAQQYMSVVMVGIQDIPDRGREAQKAWLPVETQVLTREMADALGIPNRTGVRITQVYTGSTAEKAGLAVGDLVVALDGEPIPAAHPEDYEVFASIVRQYRIGATVDLTVLRGQKEYRLPAKLERSMRLPREMKQVREENFDFTVRDIADIEKAEEKLDKNLQGVWVEDVKAGSWAALGGLLNGDLILEINGEVVADATGFEETMETIARKKPPTVVLHVLRGIYHAYLELECDWK